MNYKILLLTFVLTVSACIAKANTNPGDGSRGRDIGGGVIDAETKKPLGNVSVIAYQSNKKEKVVLTDNHGNYSFHDLKPGTYRLIFEKEGFKKVSREKVVIRSDEGCQLNIEMEGAEEFQILPGILLSDFD